MAEVEACTTSKSCRPCTQSCKCQGNCENPHNRGGTCDKCTFIPSVIVIAQNITTKLDKCPDEPESSDEFEVESENSDSGDSDNEKSLDQRTFKDYFSDDEEDLQMPDTNSFTEIDPNEDLYLDDFEEGDSD